MYDSVNNSFKLTPLLEKLKAEKESANKIQKHKHENWNENYELYRHKTKTNRLTQRQAVNIPLMKETIKTLLSKIDEKPEINWKNLDGEEDKEIIYQEIWDTQAKDNKLELVDVLDKKSVLLYGVGSKMLNLGDEGILVSALDIYDIVFDPLMEAGDVESARFVVRQNIFRTVREILADERYTKEGKKSIKIWADSPPGMIQTQTNKEDWEKKMQRIQDMGVGHADFPYYAGGDTLINLTEHYTKVWNTKNKDWERRVIVYAENCIELLNEKLEDLTGVDFWPFVVWNEDPVSNDIYADSVADLVRVPNQIANVWWSQYVENRSLANFGMHWYSPSQGYSPQTYQPGPGVMLPAPPGENINNVIKPVEITGLDGTLDAINWLTTIVERGTGATAIEKGEPEQGVQTLGEVQILVGKAMERTIGMAKFYRMAWYELAKKWDAMMQANAPKTMKLYKTGRDGKIYPKKVYSSDWKGRYEPTVESSSEREQNDVKSIQRWSLIKAQFPNNSAVQRISAKRLFEVVDISPEEMKEIEQAEKDVANQQIMQAQPQMDMSGIESGLNELASLAVR